MEYKGHNSDSVRLEKSYIRCDCHRGLVNTGNSVYTCIGLQCKLHS